MRPPSVADKVSPDVSRMFQSQHIETHYGDEYYEGDGGGDRDGYDDYESFD